MSLEIKIRKLDESLPLPVYQTEGSSGLDLYASEDCVLSSGDFKMVPTGVALEIPYGYEGEVRARSGLASKFGIGVLNSPGTIDSDYRGEIKVILFNFSKEKFEVKKGNRIAQLIISRVEKVNLIEVKELKKYFYLGGGPFKKKEAVKAIENVSFHIKRNEILGLVGESGCGKTTCGKLILRLINPTAGTIYFDKNNITNKP